MTKQRRNVNFMGIGLSLIFLFNPNINIIDFLPDFIGYILLCVSLVKLADMNETISEALKMFQRMIFIDAAKIVALLWTFGITVTTEKNASLLLWSFVFSTLEIAFAVPAFIKMFKGFVELGYLYDNSTLLSSKCQSKRSYTDKIRSFTVFFIILKSALSFLPELSELTSSAYYDNVRFENIYRYIGTMRLLAFIPALIVGIVWLIRALKYFSRLNKDSQLTNAINDDYEKRVLPKSGLFIKRNIAISFVLLMVALFFSADFRLENVNILPDMLSGIVFLAYFAVIGKKTKTAMPFGVCMSAVYIVVSTLSVVFEYKFFNEYYWGAIYRSEAAYDAYITMSVFATLSSVIFVALCVAALLTYCAVINQHTGHIRLSDASGDVIQSKMDVSARAELKRNVWFCLIAAIVYFVTDVCYIFLAKDYGILFTVNLLGALICIVVFAKSFNELRQAVNGRYLLD